MVFAWRGGRDSNPRGDYSPSGLANHRTRPLCDLPVQNFGLSVVSLEERVGFEPTRLAPGCFQDNCLKPLGHRSNWEWQAGQESNLQPADLEAAALPIELPAFNAGYDSILRQTLQPAFARYKSAIPTHQRLFS